MEFKDKLKTLRTEKGISQQALADEIFVSRSAVAKWENGLGYPGEDSWKALAEYFAVEVDYLKTEEPETVIVQKTRHIRLLRYILSVTVCIFAVAVISVCCSLFSTVKENDIDGLARQAADYLGKEEVEIIETTRRGNFLAALCVDSENNWCMCVFDRSSVFSDRWRANGGKMMFETGEMVSWNYGSPKDGAVLIFCGGELPKEIEWYSFNNGGIEYTCPVEGGTVLDIFIIPDADNINGYPIALNGEKQPLD